MNKKLIVILSVVGGILVAGAVAYFVITNISKNNEPTPEPTVTPTKTETKETKTAKVTIKFDAAGGEKVEKLVVDKGSQVLLPSTTREGYIFMGWYLNGKEVIATQVWNKNVTVVAKWEKKAEESTTSEPAQEPTKTYTCPTGYKLSGTKCTIEGIVRETCPSDTKADGSLCIKTSDHNDGTRQCKSDTVSIDGKGHTWTGTGDYYFAGFGHCAYYKWTSITNKEDCTTTVNRKATWVSALNGCYAEVKNNNYDTVCASDYQLYTSEQLSSKFGIYNNGGCYKKVAKTKYCDEGYTLTSGKCIKTIDATLK